MSDMNFWTDDKIKTLRVMHASGSSAREIGAVIGATRNSVIGKTHRLGLVEIAHWTPERLERFTVLHAAGIPYAAIGAEIGVTENAARKRAYKLKLAKRSTYSPTSHMPSRKPQKARLVHSEKKQESLPRLHHSKGYKPGLLTDMAGDQCRFIEGDHFRMCGAKVVSNHSWCAHHMTRVYRQGDGMR